MTAYDHANLTESEIARLSASAASLLDSINRGDGTLVVRSYWTRWETEARAHGIRADVMFPLIASAIVRARRAGAVRKAGWG
jgi:hypothetical protein